MLTSSFPRYRGDGAGVFISELAEHLIRRGCNISVLAPHAPGASVSEEWGRGKLSVKRFKYFYPDRQQKLCYGSGIVKNIGNNPITLIQAPCFLAAQTAALIKLAKQKKIDIVHAHWSIPQGVVAWLSRHLIQAPYIVSIHGTDVYGLQYPLLSQLNRSICREAAACTVNSKETGEAAERLLGSRNFQTIPMGVDTRLFQPADGNPVRHPTVDDALRILFVGRLIDWKGVDYLVKAVPRILTAFPKARLKIVGDGLEKAGLQRLASDLGIQKRVSFFGNIAHDELPAHYQQADVFVLPSCENKAGETEGLGVVLLEAMACGVPVIGSRIGGIPQIITDGVTGLLAEPQDHNSLASNLLKLFSRPGLRANLVANARKLIARSFSWEVISRRFVEIYAEVLSGRQSR